MPPRHGGIVDIRIFDRCADARLLDTTAGTGGLCLQVHVFLVIGAVVTDDVEHRDAMMSRHPQRARVEQEATIATEGHRQPPVTYPIKGRATRGGFG